MSMFMYSKLNMSKGCHLTACFLKGALYAEQNEDYTTKQHKTPAEELFFHTAYTS